MCTGIEHCFWLISILAPIVKAGPKPSGSTNGDSSGGGVPIAIIASSIAAVLVIAIIIIIFVRYRRM